jgi:SAM-dependent methyltransferase
MTDAASRAMGRRSPEPEMVKMRLLLVVPLMVIAAPAAAQVRVIGVAPVSPAPLAPPLTAPLPAAQDLLTPSVDAVMTLSQLQNGAEDSPHGDEQYRPSVGQAGKDVIWVPTPESLVKAMLTTAGVTKDDYVVDLGCGDGRIPIAAARDFGARAHGIDYNADMVALARRNADRDGVRTKVTFQRADIFETDFSGATVVTLYLLPSLNQKLKPTLLAMKPGTRIVSHAFDMGDWEADETIRTDDATGFLWVVPARIDGRWAFEVGSQRFAVTLSQQYQMLTGSGGPVKGGRVRGNAVTLTLADGREIEGALTDAPGARSLAGRGWTATKITG